MSAQHTAVELWKTDYWRWRYSLSRKLRSLSRDSMREIRREAALERIIARQQRSIETVKRNRNEYATEDAYQNDLLIRTAALQYGLIHGWVRA